MSDAFKVLGQQNPAAATLTTLYTVPAATAATVSTIVVANRSPSVPSTFRISVAVAGAADDPKQYLAYDLTVQGGDTIPFTLGITLAATDVLRCQAANATVSFNAFGVEIS